MKLSKIIITLLLLTLWLQENVTAQNTTKKISGTVRDSLQKSLAYVTVSLYRTSDLVNNLCSSYSSESGKSVYWN